MHVTHTPSTSKKSAQKKYKVLLYYKFTRIDQPEEFAAAHKAFASWLKLKGRVIVAHEGINGTVSGTERQCELYKEHLRSDKRLADIVFKEDDVDGHVFDKLHVRAKDEIVTFRQGENCNPTHKTGVHLSPQDFFTMMQVPGAVIVDARTDYEFDLGHFRGAVRPPLASFREFPDWVRSELADKKDAPILTYCTGGIRCEKFTAFLLNEGFSNVFQLDGGIVSYGKDPVVQGRLFDGDCYVFDKRISVPINHTADARVVSSCFHCGEPAATYVNCANIDCHKQHISCSRCQRQTLQSCSAECMVAPRRDPIVTVNTTNQESVQ